MRSARVLLSLGTAVLIGACASEPTAVVPDQESLDAASEYTRVADSLAVAGADCAW